MTTPAAASGTLKALYRHPVKGFTPESLDEAVLEAGAHFPCDRLYAVEDGPSGFNPQAPGHISKQRFTVLAKYAEVAKARTRYDERTGTITAEAPGLPRFEGPLTTEAGRAAFAGWLSAHLSDVKNGQLRVLEAPDGHRFMDHPQGFVSIINLASVRDLEARTGRAVDPLRFRGNLYVEGWPAWAEGAVPAGTRVRLGGGWGEVVKPIRRCVATHVDPATGEVDLETTALLFEHYGHMDCGLYVQVAQGCGLALGDPVELQP